MTLEEKMAELVKMLTIVVEATTTLPPGGSNIALHGHCLSALALAKHLGSIDQYAQARKSMGLS